MTRVKKIVLLLIIVLLLGSGYFFLTQKRKTVPVEYDPVIDPADFSTRITNPYFNLPPGKQFTYEAETDEGTERVVILITDRTKNILGVDTLVYWDRVYLNGLLIEDTRDYLAQDSAGNVWYFGEDVDNYYRGQLSDHDGAWLAGEDGAKPGIWMKANPKVGEVYRQEYYRGYAEDVGEIVSLSESVGVNNVIYTDCLKTRDYSLLIQSLAEYKYYCPDVGGLVLEEYQIEGEKKALVDVKTGVPTPEEFVVE